MKIRSVIQIFTLLFLASQSAMGQDSYEKVPPPAFAPGISSYVESIDFMDLSLSQGLELLELFKDNLGTEFLNDPHISDCYIAAEDYHYPHAFAALYTVQKSKTIMDEHITVNNKIISSGLSKWEAYQVRKEYMRTLDPADISGVVKNFPEAMRFCETLSEWMSSPENDLDDYLLVN